MKISNIVQKIFMGGAWYVGIRNHTESEIKTYRIVKAPQGQWIADPFLYEYEGRHFLYVEQYIKEERHACLGCYEIIDGIPSNYHVIIKTSYHMSYPCIFYYKGKHYIIPESSANNTIDLYEAVDFPFKWEKKCTLIEGEKLVDSTVYFMENSIRLLSYKKASEGWYVVLFKLDVENGEIERLYETLYSKNIGRPAGFLYKEGEILYRPSQNCSRKYGECLIINKVDCLDDKEFTEHPTYELNYKDVDVPIKIQRIHTINRDSKYEVVDLFQEKIDLLHAVKVLKRKFNL